VRLPASARAAIMCAGNGGLAMEVVRFPGAIERREHYLDRLIATIPRASLRLRAIAAKLDGPEARALLDLAAAIERQQGYEERRFLEMRDGRLAPVVLRGPI
jgi:hypothetical protein